MSPQSLSQNLAVTETELQRQEILVTARLYDKARISLREYRGDILDTKWRRQTESSKNIFHTPGLGRRRTEGGETGSRFIQRDHYTSEMKEEDRDPGYVPQDGCNNEMKEEIQDSDFKEHGYYKIVIKEEKQEPDFSDHDQHKSEIKEENEDFDVMDQSMNGIREENEETQPDPAGPSDQQVSLDMLTGKNLYHMFKR
ncbi:hypothetical protein Q8A73_012461 [Channa argus]|nr:hypothetical protein Q8A73_012461 [Channa argus]